MKSCCGVKRKERWKERRKERRRRLGNLRSVPNAPAAAGRRINAALFGDFECLHKICCHLGIYRVQEHLIYKHTEPVDDAVTSH
jgi:hypothetical protein